MPTINKTIIWEDRFEGLSDSLQRYTLKAQSVIDHDREEPLAILFKLISNCDQKVVERYNFDIRDNDSYKYSSDVISLLQGYCNGPLERSIIDKLFVIFISNSKVIQEIDPEYFAHVNDIKSRYGWT